MTYTCMSHSEYQQMFDLCYKQNLRFQTVNPYVIIDPCQAKQRLAKGLPD